MFLVNRLSPPRPYFTRNLTGLTAALCEPQLVKLSLRLPLAGELLSLGYLC